MFRIQCVWGHPALKNDGDHGFGDYVLNFTNGVCFSKNKKLVEFLSDEFPRKFKIVEVDDYEAQDAIDRRDFGPPVVVREESEFPPLPPNLTWKKSDLIRYAEKVGASIKDEFVKREILAAIESAELVEGEVSEEEED